MPLCTKCGSPLTKKVKNKPFTVVMKCCDCGNRSELSYSEYSL